MQGAVFAEENRLVGRGHSAPDVSRFAQEGLLDCSERTTKLSET